MKSRKAKRFIYIFLSTVLLFTQSSTAFAAPANTTTTKKTESKDTKNSYWPDGPKVTAESAIVMEVSSGLILYEKNIYDKHYPASITKIMTSLLAIENSSLSDTVTFSREAIFGVDMDSSRIAVDVGEKLSMEDCLYAIMLSSANEVSYGVAEHVGGTMPKFVDMMNKRATELGCVNTHFANPNGLHDDNHYTCAYDMGLIASEAIKNTTFAKITGSRTYVIPPTNLQPEARPQANHHKFVKRDIIYDGCIGGKTGYTSKAKYTLVTYAKRGDMELVSVVLASESPTSQYTDSAALLDYGFDNFSIYNISGSSFKDMADSPFFTNYSPLYSTDNPLISASEGYVVLPNSVSVSEVKKEVTYEPLKELKNGTNKIGTVTYTYHDKIVGQTSIMYNNNSKETLPTVISSNITNSQNRIPSPLIKQPITSKRNLKPFIIIGIFLLIAIILLLYYLLIERPRIKRRKAYYNRRQSKTRHKKRYR